MSSMQEFFTRQGANEGIKVPLHYPDGQESEHWLQIRGADSDSFREAEADAKRLAFEISRIEDVEERAEAIVEGERSSRYKGLASLIIDWSFDQECNEENKIKFLKEAPQIADQVNEAAGKRSLFFKKKPNAS